VYLECLHLIRLYFPLGSGPGTFEAAYGAIESDALLQPSYLNEAHNDLLQVFVELGVFAVPLLLWPAVSIARNALRAWRSGRESARIRMLVVLTSIAILAAASLVDYPLRTATALSFFTLLWCTLAHAARDTAPSLDEAGSKTERTD
jgi:O-antigen ligase